MNVTEGNYNFDAKATAATAALEPHEFLYFSKLLNRRIRIDKTNKKNGRLTDLVFRLSEPYPEMVGIYIEHSQGYPSELIPWQRVARIEEAAIFILPHESGGQYPKFVDQKGWILLNEHLMGRTILDTEGRRTEVVNDVHLLQSKGRMILVHVDISFNGFLRKWGLEKLIFGNDQLISWFYVQPFSVEEAIEGGKDIVTLSVTREQAMELPSEDLADALEVLSGDEQQAMFAALDPDKAAEVLVEAEPRAKRQLTAFLHEEKARHILEKMSVAHVANLLSDLPHEKATEMMKLLPPARVSRVKAVMHDTDVLASTLMSDRFLAFSKETRVGEALLSLRSSVSDRRNISYLHIVEGDEKLLLGIVDLRDLVTSSLATGLGDLMISPVVTVTRDALRKELVELFTKYQFRMLPVVDEHDHLLGIVRHKDIMKEAKIDFEI